MGKIRENLSWTFLIISLVFLIFLAARNITGFTISSQIANQSYLALLTFIIILIASFYIIRINRKSKK